MNDLKTIIKSPTEHFSTWRNQDCSSRLLLAQISVKRMSLAAIVTAPRVDEKPSEEGDRSFFVRSSIRARKNASEGEAANDFPAKYRLPRLE